MDEPSQPFRPAEKVPSLLAHSTSQRHTPRRDMTTCQKAASKSSSGQCLAQWVHVFTVSRAVAGGTLREGLPRTVKGMPQGEDKEALSGLILLYLGTSIPSPDPTSDPGS